MTICKKIQNSMPTRLVTRNKGLEVRTRDSIAVPKMGGLSPKPLWEDFRRTMWDG